MLNAAFAPELGERFAPLRAGRKERRWTRTARCGCSPSTRRGRAARRAAGHEHAGLGRARAAARPRAGRRPAVAAGGGAPDRGPAARARSTPGRRAGDMVVLVRATAIAAAARGGAGGAGPADLRRRRPRLLVARSRSATGSRGCACSRTRTTRRRCSPCSPRRSTARARTSSSGSRRTAARAGAAGRGAGARRPGRARCWPPSAAGERAPLEVLLERAIVATGYDLAMLAGPGGDRRLANLRKLMRLAASTSAPRAATCAASSPTPPRATSPRRARARPRWSPKAWTRCA